MEEHELIKLISPFPFKESILLFGEGGSGKSDAIAQCARFMQDSRFGIVDTDYSQSWQRAMSMDFPDIEERVDLYRPDATWDAFLLACEEAVEELDPAKDVLVIDSISPSWEQVQSKVLTDMYGDDRAAHMISLRAEFQDDLKAYQKAVTDDMNWPAVKAEYAKLYRLIGNWEGHLLLTAEAKQVSTRDQGELQQTFSTIGMKPTGEGRLFHVPATIIYLKHKNRDTWTATTAKERGRSREQFDGDDIENFALDYLRERAGWVPRRRQ